MNFLRYLTKYFERFLKTDIYSLAEGSIWLTIGKVAGLVVAIATSVVYGQFIDKDVYGNYRFILSIFGMLGIFALPGMATSIVRSVARGFDGTFRSASRLIFISSCATTLIGTSIAIYFILLGKTGIGIGIFAIALLTPMAEGLGNWRAFFEGKQQFREKTLWVVLTNVLHGIAMIGTTIAIFYWHIPAGNAIAILATVHIIASAIPNVILSLKVVRGIPPDAPVEDGSLRYGLHSSLAGIPSTIAYSIDSLLLYTFLGPASVAVYSFAIAPIEQLKAFINSIADVAFPQLSSKMTTLESRERLQKTLMQKIMRASLITLLIVCAYFIAAPFLFDMLFPQYHDAVFLSQIFSLSLILVPMSILDKTLKAEGNIAKIYIYNAASPIILISTLLILIPFYGLWGAIVGRLIGKITNFLFLYILFKI